MIRLRDATPDDLALLRRWDEEPHVLAASDDDWEWETQLPRSPAWREWLIAELNDRPIGFLQIIDPALEETHYWGDVPADLRAIDIWIGEPDCLGQGLGTEMMRQACERCFAEPAVRAILIDPLVTNVRAHRFYEQIGFRFVERRTFFDDVCLVYRLERATFEAETPPSIEEPWPAEVVHAVIDHYLAAYNARDVEAMMHTMHPEVEFENVAGDQVTASAQGAEAFRALADRGAQLFASRHQRIASYEPTERGATVTIDFEGTLAEDLPDGPRAGETLRLTGRSEFELLDGRIRRLRDLS
ncbi:MAG: GNAT family N-acetyltransferase [Acidobacteriota bacterium]